MITYGMLLPTGLGISSTILRHPFPSLDTELIPSPDMVGCDEPCIWWQLQTDFSFLYVFLHILLLR